MATNTDRIRTAFEGLLAQDGRPSLVWAALACARFVLPLYEARIDADHRPRRALAPHRSLNDLYAADTAVDEAYTISTNATAYQAAMAAWLAAKLALSFPSGGGETVLFEAVQCGRAAAEAVRWALATGSAQERLELLVRLKGASCFDAVLEGWLADADRDWLHPASPGAALRGVAP